MTKNQVDGKEVAKHNSRENVSAECDLGRWRQS